MRVVILGSGRGSNAEAILQAQQAGRLGRARVVQIFSDKPDAGILALGPRFGVPANFLDAAPYKTKLDGDGEQHYIATILSCQADLIVLAGFMRVLTPWFVTRWQGKLINIHPSLLPEFRGTHTHARALEAGVAEHGCTVHFVLPELDAGPTILQAKVPVLPGDDEARLSARVLEQEHRIYPQALALVASGAVKLEDGMAVGA